MSSQPAIETICSTLNEGAERPRSQVTAIVDALGEVRAMALLAETQRIELSGGMLVPDGSRRRTPGGVFFVLARRALSPHDRDRIFTEGRQHAPAPKPAAPAASAPAPARAAPPPNNGNTARRFENRPYQSSSSFSSGSAYGHGSSNAHGRTHTYTAHGSTRQTTVEFSSRLGSQAAQPAAAPPPPPAPTPPKPPTLTEQGQKLVPLRRRIVSLPALQPEVKPPSETEVAAETSQGKSGRGRGQAWPKLRHRQRRQRHDAGKT